MDNKVTSILIVDDDHGFLETRSNKLISDGYTVRTADNPKKAVNMIVKDNYDIALLDIRIDKTSGIELLTTLKEISPETEFIMITGFPEIETVVKAIKSGAYDYISKSSPHDELLLKIAKAVEKKADLEEIHKLRDALKEKYSFKNIIGRSEKMQEVYGLIETVCDTDVSILIKGETGTGKELVARAIHFNSNRKQKPFIAINCAAISETLIESELFGHVKGAFTGAIKDKQGKLEIAAGGTVFLDEIGDLSINLQAKLLRVLQDKKFERVGGNTLLSTDARILSATNKNIEQLIHEGRFREDLFYRINVVSINIPPLRERIDDIKMLLDHFLEIANREFNKKIEGFSDSALDSLLLYTWPGNVRELENLVKKLALTVKTVKISADDVAASLKKTDTASALKTASIIDLPWDKMMDKNEKEYFELLLRYFNGDINLACKKANLHKRTIYKKMKRFNLRKEDFQQRRQAE